MLKFELVGEWKTVLVRSYASLLGMLATLLGLVAIAAPYIGVLQGSVSPLVFGIMSVLCSAAVPYARVVKQEQLRILTGPANPQPTATATLAKDGAQ